MRTRLLTALALALVLPVGLLVGPTTAQAAFIYSFSGGTAEEDFNFSLTTSSLITSATFLRADFDQLSPPFIDRVSFVGLDAPEFSIRFHEGDFLPTTFPFFDAAAATGPGIYCQSGFCDFFSLTIRQTAVPEPGTLALLGLGLLGLGVVRRRAE